MPAAPTTPAPPLTDAHAADLRAHVRGLQPGPETYPAPPHGWTCFHCGETFRTEGGAALHFGGRPGIQPRPACLAALSTPLRDHTEDHDGSPF